MDLSLQEIRIDLAARSKWNLGYFYAGLVFWIYAGVVGWMLPLQTAKFYWLFGTSIILPVALVASKLLHADPFSKGNPLGEAVGGTHASVMAMTFPLVLIACLRYPQFMILIMAISFSLDFYLMSWAFGSRIFALHAFNPNRAGNGHLVAASRSESVAHSSGCGARIWGDGHARSNTSSSMGGQSCNCRNRQDDLIPHRPGRNSPSASQHLELPDP